MNLSNMQTRRIQTCLRLPVPVSAFVKMEALKQGITQQDFFERLVRDYHAQRVEADASTPPID